MRRRMTIHYDQPISPEAAQLLGVPFTWMTAHPDYSWAFKFVPGERSGLAFLDVRAERGWFEDTGNYGRTYVESIQNGSHAICRVTIHEDEIISE